MTEIYYMQTGAYNTEKGVVVREKEKHNDGTVTVVDELTNGSGGGFTLNQKGLIPMTKEDYDEIIKWNMEPTDENLDKIYAKIDELVPQ